MARQRKQRQRPKKTVAGYFSEVTPATNNGEWEEN
jgi:hypothetical protein